MPFGKTIHDAETFYVVVEGQVVINGVEIIEALFLTYSQFYIFNIEYYQDNIASWQFIQHVIAENKGGKVLKKVITLTQIYVCIVCFFFLRGCQSLDIQNDPTIKIASCPNVLLLSIYFPHACIHFCKIIIIL